MFDVSLFAAMMFPNMTDKPTTTINEKFEGKRTKGSRYRSSEFDHDFLKVFLEQPFLGVISMEVNKTADEGAPTAYMGAMKVEKDYELTLGYNPDFFRSLSPDERQGVICHELYHLIFSHVTKRTVADTRMQKLWNVATDLAINSIIGDKKLPKFALIPGRRPVRLDPKTKKIVDAGDKDLWISSRRHQPYRLLISTSTR